MYYILQTNTNQEETIIDLVLDYNEFNENINNLVKKEYKDFRILQEVSLEDLKTNLCFSNGIYFLNINKEILLVDKFAQINRGYVYNSEETKISVINKWRLIKSDIKNNNTFYTKKYYNSLSKSQDLGS